MQRICEELNYLGKPYRKLRLKNVKFPLERYPKYVMILFLDIMQYRDDLIYGLCVLEEFTRAGVKLIPPLKGMYLSDKFSNYLLWNSHLKNKVKMPDTLCSIEIQMCIDFLQKHKKVLFKPIAGSMGEGIELVEDEAHLKKLQDRYHALFLQELVLDRGYDIRTFVIGNRIVAQYARYNPTHLLKNVHLGAEPKSIVEMGIIDPEIDKFSKVSIDIAKEVRKVAELDIIGVDTLPSKNGETYLIEWNAVPGFRGAELATKQNIAKEIVDFLFKR